MEENTRNPHKGFKVFIVILIIGFLFISIKSNRNKILDVFQSLSIRDKSLVLTKSIPIEEDINCINIYENTIIKNRHSTLSFLKLDGTLSFEKDFKFSNPYVYIRDKYIYVADKDNGDIYSLNKKGETINRIELKNPLFSLKETQNGLIAHIKTSDMESINILDNEGKSIRIHDINQGNILTFTMNEENSKYILSTLSLEGMLKSITKSYSIDGKELYSTEFPSEIVLFSEYVDKDIIVLSDKSLYYLKNGEIQWKRQFLLVKDILMDKDGIHLLYENNFETINLEGRTLNKLVFTKEYNTILSMDKFILLYGENDIVAIQEFKEIAKLNLDKKIIGVSGNKSIIGIHYLDNMEIYEIRNR